MYIEMPRNKTFDSCCRWLHICRCYNALCWLPHHALFQLFSYLCWKLMHWEFQNFKFTVFWQTECGEVINYWTSSKLLTERWLSVLKGLLRSQHCICLFWVTLSPVLYCCYKNFKIMFKKLYKKQDDYTSFVCVLANLQKNRTAICFIIDQWSCKTAVIELKNVVNHSVF